MEWTPQGWATTDLVAALDPVTVAWQQLLPGGSEEEAVMPNPVYLEPQARAVADANANPPYLFELGPDQGRRTVDAVQSGPVKKLVVDIEDTTVPGGPSGQVSVRILRPQGARRPLAVDRKSTRLNSSHYALPRMPSSA